MNDQKMISLSRDLFIFDHFFSPNIRKTLSFWMFLESTFPKNFSHLCLFKCFFFFAVKFEPFCTDRKHLFARLSRLVYVGPFFFDFRENFLVCVAWEMKFWPKNIFIKKPLEDQTAKVLPKENESKHFNFNFLLKSKFHECQPFDGKYFTNQLVTS